MKRNYEGTELWPFDSSTSSTASTPKISERQVDKEDQAVTTTVGGGTSSTKQPVTYSAFGVTISTFKGSILVWIHIFNAIMFYLLSHLNFCNCIQYNQIQPKFILGFNREVKQNFLDDDIERIVILDYLCQCHTVYRGACLTSLLGFQRHFYQ